MKENCYYADLKCCNCKASNWRVEIPKGVTIEEFGKQTNVKCKSCDCFIIKVKAKKE